MTPVSISEGRLRDAIGGILSQLRNSRHFENVRVSAEFEATQEAAKTPNKLSHYVYPTEALYVIKRWIKIGWPEP